MPPEESQGTGGDDDCDAGQCSVPAGKKAKCRCDQHRGQCRERTEKKASELQKDIDSIQSEWDQADSEIPADALEIFKRVAETYDGEALAYVEQSDEKVANYNCGGCFMGLTMETMNQLMTRDEIIRCPNCSRILVIKE